MGRRGRLSPLGRFFAARGGGALGLGWLLAALLLGVPAPSARPKGL